MQEARARQQQPQMHMQQMHMQQMQMQQMQMQQRGPFAGMMNPYQTNYLFPQPPAYNRSRSRSSERK